MPENQCRLTVFFEDPFWVGVFERSAEGRLEAAKLTFGAQPSDREIYDLILRRWSTLRFGPAVPTDKMSRDIANPKRRRRAIGAQLAQHGPSTRSQLALQLQREAEKARRQEHGREKREAEKARRFALRRERRKEKRRGR